jgi:hypothetical protein
MSDVDGPTIAHDVYSKLFTNGELDMAAVPFALDEAVMNLRRGGVPVSRWGTYVHFGA